MKKSLRLMALLLTLVLAAGLFAGCGKEEETDEGEVDNRNVATSGGSISWPEGFELGERFSSQQQGDTLYISFNGIQSRNSGYFSPAGDSITITGRATTESEKRKEYRVTLWKQTTASREYVTGGTMYLTADGSCYTGTFSNLQGGARYKIGIAYDGGSYYMSGGVTVSGLVDNSAEMDEQEAKEKEDKK